MESAQLGYIDIGFLSDTCLVIDTQTHIHKQRQMYVSVKYVSTKNWIVPINKWTCFFYIIPMEMGKKLPKNSKCCI